MSISKINSAFAAISVMLFTVFNSSVGQASADTPVQNPSPLAAGYTEQYSFKINGKSIGTQSATLVKVANGVQTWTFSLDLLLPINTQSVSLKQSGTFVLGSDAQPVSLDTVALVNGASQSEKITFGAAGAVAVLEPPDPAIASPIPVVGSPYLLVNNLMTLISLATRANYGKQMSGYTIPVFGANSLRQATISLQPSTDQQTEGSPFRVFDATISSPGLPSSTSQYWLSSSTGALERCSDKSQGLEVTRTD